MVEVKPKSIEFLEHEATKGVEVKPRSIDLIETKDGMRIINKEDE